jgi:cysteinyl-tRNA synthetase
LLKLFNTLTNKKEKFKPREAGKVEMYTCGPSVYRKPHIGNYRTFLYEDVLQRYLEYIGYDVVRLVTITDVEDKSIAEAEREGMPLEELTQKNMAIFLSDIKLLKMKPPNYAPRSSTSVDQAVDLTKTLLEKGYAYWYRYKSRHNAYYDPLKFKDFGKVSHLNMSEWPEKKRRFHRDTYPSTPWNKGDFVLWHGYKEGDKAYWDTEIGRGRPAWNVQDAAMVAKHLGFSVDVACGGVDNLARHHDYTVAVAEGVSSRDFARYWLHGEHLFVDGKKMSKSRGNVYYPETLIEKGYEREHIRFFLIYGQYRKKLNFTLKKLEERTQRLNRLKNMVAELQKAESTSSDDSAENMAEEIAVAFKQHMNNDLDVKAAFDDVFTVVSKLKTLRKEGKLSHRDAQTAITNLRKIDNVLKVIF